MTHVATLTSKGQTTIPHEIRTRLGLEAGDKLTFTVLSDSSVILRRKSGDLRDLAGMLRQHGSSPVPVEDMDPWR